MTLATAQQSSLPPIQSVLHLAGFVLPTPVVSDVLSRRYSPQRCGGLNCHGRFFLLSDLSSGVSPSRRLSVFPDVSQTQESTTETQQVEYRAQDFADRPQGQGHECSD